jgi:hypothetical protein
MVLCFALGAAAALLRSDLKLPKGAYDALAIYLLLAIGLKGGVALSKVSIGEIAGPIAATIVLGSLIPVAVFGAARTLGRLNAADSAALAAHYGSVSAVTFIAALTFLNTASVTYESYVATLVAVMEIPGIVIAMLLGRRAMGKGGDLREALHEVVTGKSILLIGGGLFIGWLTGERGYKQVEPFFVQPFQGALCIFMLDMGLLAMARLADVRRAGAFVVGLGIVTPLINGVLGVLVGTAVGLSPGGTCVLGTLAASASYIAAPAAVRIALPEANPSIYLTAAIGVTFPFNLALGIPLYYELARRLAGG